MLKVTQAYYPFLERGGPAVKVRSLARRLAEKGHNVTVLTADLDLANAPNFPSFALDRVPGGWRHEEDGVEALYLRSRGSYRSLTWNPGAFEFCRQRLASFDVVHIYGTYDLLGPIVARACRKKAIPYVLEPMGMFRPMVRNFALKRVYRRLIGESVARGAARVVATSAQEQRELIEEGVAPGKIVIRRNGIDLPRITRAGGTFRGQWNIPQEALLVLFLGRIVNKKSPELLLQAFGRWQEQLAGTHKTALAFVGPFEDQSYRRKLEAQLASLGLGSSVLFTGPLYDERKWSALADADIFVLPSQNENFGNAAAEAVACGTPVIVTDRCGIAPLVEGRAGLVIAHECDALVRALHQLSDSRLRVRLKQGCKNVAVDLGWEQPLAETEALYSELLTRRQHSAARAPDPAGAMI